jgi:hypothetical protein
MRAKRYGVTTAYEIEGLETTCRVFALYQQGHLLGWLTADSQTNTIELVYVLEPVRGRGVATVLLDFARETTGLSLDQDTGERTLLGSAWARKQGIKIAPGRRYRRLAERDIARQIASLSWALLAEPETEEAHA